MPQDESAYYNPDAREKIKRDYENAMKEDRGLVTRRARRIKRDQTVKKSVRSSSKARGKRAQTRRR